MEWIGVVILRLRHQNISSHNERPQRATRGHSPAQPQRPAPAPLWPPPPPSSVKRRRPATARTTGNRRSPLPPSPVTPPPLLGPRHSGGLAGHGRADPPPPVTDLASHGGRRPPPSSALLLPVRRPSCARGRAWAAPGTHPPCYLWRPVVPNPPSLGPDLATRGWWPPPFSARFLPLQQPPCLRGRAWELPGALLLSPAGRLAGGAGSALPGSGSGPLRLVAASSPCCIMAPPEPRGASGWRVGVTVGLRGWRLWLAVSGPVKCSPLGLLGQAWGR